MERFGFEVFYPAAETGEPELPWAREGAEPRARRIIAQDRSAAPEWPEQEWEHLRSLARYFLDAERDRLERWIRG